MKKYALLFLSIFFISCSIFKKKETTHKYVKEEKTENTVKKTPETNTKIEEISNPEVPKELGHGYDFKGNGRNLAAPILPDVYNRDTISQELLQKENLLKTKEIDNCLNQQFTYLNRRNKNQNFKIGKKIFSVKQLEKTAKYLEQWKKDSTKNLSDFFELYKIKGEDGRGNVHFTGYYIPVIDVNNKKDSIYKYPIYRRPKKWKGKLPSRKKIDNDKILKGRNLEIAYAKDLLEIFFMQVQGSGYGRFPDGNLRLFSYGGGNGHEYKSLGKMLISNNHISAKEISLPAIREWFSEYPDSLETYLYKNPSYLFFVSSVKKPTGAAVVPLTAGHSIAVDKKFIPFGSTLLAAIPLLDENGLVHGHAYRLLFAQDTGGAIKGSGHVDIFFGVGKKARKSAGNLHHYGNLWILMPKKE